MSRRRQRRLARWAVTVLRLVALYPTDGICASHAQRLARVPGWAIIDLVWELEGAGRLRTSPQPGATLADDHRLRLFPTDRTLAQEATRWAAT